MNIGSIFSAALLVVAGGQVQAAQLTATSATFQSIMTRAVGGDTVKLSGEFGRANLINKDYKSLVTIDASGASFSDTFVMRNVSNVNFTGGRYGSETSMTSWGRAVVVYGGNNVSFTNPYVVGYYGNQGIFISGTINAAVSGATLLKLDTGIIFDGVTNGSVTNSKVINGTRDGIDISNSSHIDVGYNSCTGGTPTIGAHPDCVQLWSAVGHARQDNIAVHDNYASGGTQGFTNFGSNGIGSDFISITDNQIDGLFSQGIACFSCSNSTITGNILNSLDGAKYRVSLNVLYGTNNTVSGNTVGVFNKAAAAPTVFYDRQTLVPDAVAPTFRQSTVAAVPEPLTWSMMIIGFTAIGLSQRRQKYVAA